MCKVSTTPGTDIRAPTFSQGHSCGGSLRSWPPAGETPAVKTGRSHVARETRGARQPIARRGKCRISNPLAALFFSSSLCSFITDLTSTSHADCSTHRYTRPQRCLLSPKLSTMKVAAQQHAYLRHPCQLAGICHDGCQAIHNVSVPAPSLLFLPRYRAWGASMLRDALRAYFCRYGGFRRWAAPATAALSWRRVGSSLFPTIHGLHRSRTTLQTDK